jgi:hypothetical protein
MQRFALLLCGAVLAVGSASAQQEYSKYSLDLGGGYTATAGATGNYARWGWNVKGGFDWNFSPRLGAALNVGYDSLPISSPAAFALGVPGGHVDVMHATVDPVFHLLPSVKRADFYLTAGGGYFRVYRQFSAAESGPSNAYLPSLGFGPPVNGPVPIPLTYSVNKPGFDVGGGVTVGAVGRGKIFAEARWEHVFLNGGHLDLLPVTFGFRW